MDNFRGAISELREYLDEIEERVNEAEEAAKKDIAKLFKINDTKILQAVERILRDELKSFVDKGIKEVLKEKALIVDAVAKELKAEKLREHTKEIDAKIASFMNEINSRINTIERQIAELKNKKCKHK